MDAQRAYTELLRRHRNMIWRMCWLRTRGDYERCRDLVQEVSIAIWLHFKQLHPEASLHEERSWVRWLTRTTLDHLHRNQRPPMLALTEAMVETIRNTDNSSEDTEAILSTLTADEREIIQLHMDGYRADEIAEVLGVSRNLVYQRMHRVRKKISRVLLVLLLVTMASGLAIAVVPQWRKTILSSSETIEEDVESPQYLEPKSVPSEIDTVIVEMGVDTMVPQIIHQLIPLPDKILVQPSMYGDTLPSMLPLKQFVTISVSGSTLIITGLQGEWVTIRSPYGPILASQKCYGMGVFRLFPYDDFSMRSRKSFEIQIGDTLFFDITL